MLFFCIVVVGFISINNLPLELTPHAEFPKLSITINWAGTSPEAVEAFLTAPVEAEIATVKGVKSISSRSTQGSSSIDVEFHPSTDMDLARLEINEKLLILKDELPNGVTSPSISDYVPDEFHDLLGFITYTVSADINASEIRRKIEDIFYYPLMSIDGIVDVAIRGGTKREISVLVDYKKASAFGITQEEIRTAVNSAQNIVSAGNIKANGTQHFITVNDYLISKEKIEEQIVKKNADESVIKIKDIAVVTDEYSEPTNYYRINGNETVSIIISKEQGANSIDVANKVNAKVNELAKLLPSNYIINKEIDKSEAIVEELNELYVSGIYSAVIILVVLLLLFRRLKYSLIVLSSIVFSLLFSFSLFYLFNLSLNILTISAFILGFGLMVDNSIVVIDYIDKYYNGRGIKYLSITLKNIFFPVFASTLTTISVFIPLLFLTGELRIYFEQFALGIIFTLFASLISSFTFIPSFYFSFFKIHNGEKELTKGLFFRSYQFLLRLINRHKKVSFIIVILMIGLPVWLIPNRIENTLYSELYNSIFDSEFYHEIQPYVNYSLGGAANLFFNHVSRGELWSSDESTYIVVRLELPHGNEIARINKLTKDFEREILAYRNNINSLISNVYDEENAVIRIEFTDEQSRSSFPYMLKNYLTSYATRIGGLNVGVYGYGPGFFSGGNMISSMAVVVKGYNYLHTKEIAEEFRKIVSVNPRIDNVDIDKSEYYWTQDIYEVVGRIDRKKLDMYNISVRNLFNIISQTTEGNIGYDKFVVGNEEVQSKIKYSNYKKVQLTDVVNLIVNSNSGQKIKTKNLVDFEIERVLGSINRENQQYIRYITFDYKGPYKYGNQFVESSIEKLVIPEGYSIAKREFMFRFGEEDEINIFYILLTAAILIFMITSSLFESLKKPSLIIVAIPFALIGTIALFYFGEYNIDRGAYAGMLLLIGLSINNSIILIDHLSRNLLSKDLEKLITLSYDRLRPIFITTLTTACALIPLAIGPESSFWKSLSLSVIGGIIFSATIVVLILPILYYNFLAKK